MLLHPNCCSTSAPTYLDPIRSYICTLYDINNQSSCTITSASHMHRHICVQAHIYIYASALASKVDASAQELLLHICVDISIPKHIVHLHLHSHQQSLHLHPNFYFTSASPYRYPSTYHICICPDIDNRFVWTLIVAPYLHQHIHFQAHVTSASALTSLIDASAP